MKNFIVGLAAILFLAVVAMGYIALGFAALIASMNCTPSRSNSQTTATERKYPLPDDSDQTMGAQLLTKQGD